MRIEITVKLVDNFSEDNHYSSMKNKLENGTDGVMQLCAFTIKCIYRLLLKMKVTNCGSCTRIV